MQGVGRPTFEQTFSKCPFPEGVMAALGTYPVEVRVIKAERAMEVRAWGTPVPEELLALARDTLQRCFKLNTVSVSFEAPAAAPEEPEPSAPVPQEPPAAEAEKPEDIFAKMEAMRHQVMEAAPKTPEAQKSKTRQIYGKISSKKAPVSMGELQLDMGSVLVEGKVFNIEHRELPKRKAWVVCFDVTDNTGSIRINRFMEDEEARPIVKEVKVGQRLQVQGRLNLNRFDGEMVLEPYGIMEVPHPEGRKDTAEEKRIELHLHTKMSLMDALCDTKAVVNRAIEWGHPAIAITDHGVVQSFPDAYNASKRGEKIKILYGVEAYFHNDVDEVVAVHGPGNMPLDGEFVAFDLETTGLNARSDAIIEIGAVRMKNGEVLERFSSFADPGHPLSAATVSLTNITDELVAGAPSPEEAVDNFLDWL
ncbi:MAG: PHP domain-containing protein, partial [Oscillospiraceae bacterium]|nr:PHP domain-containing protein [Oscillospiraceae bacterium]